MHVLCKLSHGPSYTCRWCILIEALIYWSLWWFYARKKVQKLWRMHGVSSGANFQRLFSFSPPPPLLLPPQFLILLPSCTRGVILTYLQSCSSGSSQESQLESGRGWPESGHGWPQHQEGWPTSSPEEIGWPTGQLWGEQQEEGTTRERCRPLLQETRQVSSSENIAHTYGDNKKDPVRYLK